MPSPSAAHEPGGFPHSAAHEHSHATTSGPVADASVRLARASDAPAVGLVQERVWRAAYGHLLSTDVLGELSPAAFTHAWRASLATPTDPRHALLVACAGEQVVGFVAVGPSVDPDVGADPSRDDPAMDDLGASLRSGRGEILTLGVHPAARRAGHGSRLLNAAVDTLRGRSFTSMTAWLLADDEATRAFLAAAGMSPDGAFRDRVVGLDGATAREVRMAADLTPQD